MIEKAVILSTGDELTSGLTVDTNSNHIADKLFEIGIDLVAVVTVGDDAERIRWAFTSATCEPSFKLAACSEVTERVIGTDHGKPFSRCMLLTTPT